MAITASSVLASNSLEDFRIEFNNLVTDVDAIQLANTFDTRIIFEGSTVDGFETALTLVDPTADRSIVLPNVSGNLIVDGNPISANSESLGTVSLEWSDAFFADGSILYFGDDQDVTLTHVADTGLTLNLMMAATTFEPTGDTASGDNAAIGYTSAEGLILTGQGSTNDVTIKNDADATVISIPTGTTGVTLAGTLGSGAITSTGIVTGTAFTAGSAVLAEAELELLDGLTAGTAIASKVVTTDASIDTNGQRNLTISGGFSAALITTSGIIKTDDTTAATSTTDGSLQTDGGLSVAADAVIGDDLIMLSDASVIHFGADSDITLTHNADAGLTLNGVMVANAFTAGNAVLAESELELLDGLTAGTAIASKGVTTDANIDTNGQRNLTISGGFSAALITTSGIIKTDDTTEATSTTDGSLQTDGGLSVAKDAVFGDDVKLLSDSAVLSFGADSDVTLTHAADTSMTLNVMMAATTFEPSGDTAAGDNAAIGYTAAEGLILTGQGSTGDITLKNDADAIVF